MPLKRGYRRKRPMRRKKVYRKKRAIPLTTSKVYAFHRTREQLLALENPSAGATGWLSTFDDCVLKTFTFSMGELEGYTEFTNLFESYKLNMAVLAFYPTYSQIASTTAATVSSNIIITIWPNRHGEQLTTAFTRDDLNQIQRKRQFMFPINRPTFIKMPLRQLSAMYNSAVNTDYATVKPRYINTSEVSTPHYGFNVHITQVDRGAFSSNSPRLLIKEKLYFTCKQVK